MAGIYLVAVFIDKLIVLKYLEVYKIKRGIIIKKIVNTCIELDGA